VSLGECATAAPPDFERFKNMFTNVLFFIYLAGAGAGDCLTFDERVVWPCRCGRVGHGFRGLLGKLFGW